MVRPSPLVMMVQTSSSISKVDLHLLGLIFLFVLTPSLFVCNKYFGATVNKRENKFG